MEVNEELREHIFEIVNNQLKSNDPPETKKTYNRLRKKGYNDFQAKQLIGQCVVVEMFDVVQQNEPYNNKRYIRHLKALPKAPF